MFTRCRKAMYSTLGLAIWFSLYLGIERCFNEVLLSEEDTENLKLNQQMAAKVISIGILAIPTGFLLSCLLPTYYAVEDEYMMEANSLRPRSI